MLSNNFNSSKRLTYENLTDTLSSDNFTYTIMYGMILGVIDILNICRGI